MPTKAFEVIVSVTGDIRDEQIAIAEASRYLAYADQTDTFGYSGDVFEVHAYDGHEAGFTQEERLDWGIGLHFVATIENDEALARFLSEMEQLARVETVEELPYVPN